MNEKTQLSALVASRICHDMVEPMSAIIQGLEMMKSAEGGKPDPDALSLIDHGVGKAWAKLEFFRFAMGGATAQGDSELEEGRAVALKLYSALKPELVWKAPAAAMPRAAARVLVNWLLPARESLATGGAAAKAGAGGEVRILAQGPRASLRAPTAAALKGEDIEGGLTGHTIQPSLTGLLARQGEVEIEVVEGEEQVELIARSAKFKL